MTDREKVIKGLGEALTLLAEYVPCEGYLGYAPGACLDAIELLKAQEPVTVIPAIMGNDELLTEGCCPICGAKLDYYLNGQFCGCCGQAVKWE